MDEYLDTPIFQDFHMALKTSALRYGSQFLLSVSTDKQKTNSIYYFKKDLKWKISTIIIQSLIRMYLSMTYHFHLSEV